MGGEIDNEIRRSSSDHNGLTTSMQENDFVGRYLLSAKAGKYHSDSSWVFTADHRAIEDGREVGTWHLENDKAILKYHHLPFGTAKIWSAQDELVAKTREAKLGFCTTRAAKVWGAGPIIGVNEHTNGQLFHWKLNKLPTPPDKTKSPESWSFAIATNGANPDFHKKIIESVRAQKIPEYEIIFCTENKDYKMDEPDVKIIYIGTERNNWITKKKNEMTKAAKYPVICYMHDYVFLENGWYDGFQKFGYEWDVCMNRVLRPDGKRLRDWMSLDHPTYKHHEIPYDVLNITDNMYVSGTYWCAWKYFMLHFPLDESLSHNQNEDGKWSKKVRKVWDLKFNPHSVARCLRYSTV